MEPGQQCNLAPSVEWLGDFHLPIPSSFKDSKRWTHVRERTLEDQASVHFLPRTIQNVLCQDPAFLDEEPSFGKSNIETTRHYAQLSSGQFLDLFRPLITE